VEFLQQANNTMTLSLSGNPISCDCDALALLFFVRSNPQRVQDIGEVMCTKQKSLQQMEAFELCPSYVLLISCVIGGMVIIICLITVFYLMFQQELKIWLYNNNLCLWWVSEEELDKDKTYDAFISYSHKDEELISKLLPKLESGPHPFRICLHDRDWLVGDCIPEQIVRTVDDSKRVIIVLSQHFIDSVWARMEFRIAYQATLQDKRKRIIIILYRELENMNGIDSELRAYLKLNTYLKWGDPLLWSKLCYAMPHNRRVLKGQKKHFQLSLPRTDFHSARFPFCIFYYHPDSLDLSAFCVVLCTKSLVTKQIVLTQLFAALPPCHPNPQMAQIAYTPRCTFR